MVAQRHPAHSTPRGEIPAIARRELPAPSPLASELGARPFRAPPPAMLIRGALWARRFLQGLADRVVPAEIAVFERAWGLIQTMCLGAAARYGIADLLAQGPLTAGEIAARTGTNADAMHRLLRGLATLGIFRLNKDGTFENNRMSNGLLGGELGRVREFAQYVSSQSNVIAWSDFDRTLETGDNAFERVLGMSVWEWFERHPDEREMFAQTMMGFTVRDAPVIAKLYPFHEIALLCDVGGGRGTLLSEILIRTPNLRGILCDAAGVLESAKALLDARGVRARVELRAASFFESVPAGADAYLLKNILHDWDDERCTLILRMVRRAMKPGQRVIIVEALVPKNETHGVGPLADLQMMIVCSNGRERSVDELHALLRATGFEPARVFPFPTISIVEGLAR